MLHRLPDLDQLRQTLPRLGQLELGVHDQALVRDRLKVGSQLTGKAFGLLEIARRAVEHEPHDEHLGRDDSGQQGTEFQVLGRALVVQPLQHHHPDGHRQRQNSRRGLPRKNLVTLRDWRVRGPITGN